MAETIQVPCFRYGGKPLLAPLVIESGDGVRSFVRCRIRRQLVPLTPEERVRQALVWFLTEGTRVAAIGQHFRIGVEERSLDVAGFAVGSGAFAPYITGAIIETKRIEAELAGHVEQLKSYMLRERCRAGLLFNGRQANWLTQGGEFANPMWALSTLADLSDVERRLETAALKVGEQGQSYLKHFEAARSGNFDSLLHLVSFFGQDTGLSFTLSVRSKGSIGSMRAFNLRTEPDGQVGYRIRGVSSKHRQALTRAEFHSLVSVLPL